MDMRSAAMEYSTDIAAILRRVRWQRRAAQTLGLCLAGTIACLGTLGLRQGPSTELTDFGNRSAGIASLFGVRSRIDQPNKLDVSATAGEVHVKRLRAFGPFRIGFLRSVVARDLRIDVASSAPGRPPELAALASPPDVLAQLFPRGRAVVRAEVEGFHLTQRAGGQVVLALDAQRCETGFKTLECRRGVISYPGTKLESFDRASFDGTSWRIDD
jgi:hypothetical protein